MGRLLLSDLCIPKLEQIWVVFGGGVVCVVIVLVCMNVVGCVVRGGVCLHF